MPRLGLRDLVSDFSLPDLLLEEVLEEGDLFFGGVLIEGDVLFIGVLVGVLLLVLGGELLPELDLGLLLW